MWVDRINSTTSTSGLHSTLRLLSSPIPSRRLVEILFGLIRRHLQPLSVLCISHLQSPPHTSLCFVFFCPNSPGCHTLSNFFTFISRRAIHGQPTARLSLCDSSCLSLGLLSSSVAIENESKTSQPSQHRGLALFGYPALNRIIKMYLQARNWPLVFFFEPTANTCLKGGCKG